MAETRLTGAMLLDAAFRAAAEQGRAALMPYMMGGFPDLATSHAVAEAYVSEGADIVELGVPFSDPLADGPVIHAAATTALDNGATFDSVMGLAVDMAHAVPVVLMVYANAVLARGPIELARELDANGVAGIIVPDLPPEEGGEVAEALRAAGLALVPLVAPTTSPERRARLCAGAQGFVYVVSDTRTTGERERLPAALGELVAATRADSPVPVAVGFGIGTPEQAAEVGKVADGVIIGSRLVRAVSEAGGGQAAASDVARFIRDTREAMAFAGRGVE
jgi:tryptophan synthase alpha chain